MLIPFSIRKYRGTAPDDVADFLYKSLARYDRVPGASRGIHSFNFTRDFYAAKNDETLSRNKLFGDNKIACYNGVTFKYNIYQILRNCAFISLYKYFKKTSRERFLELNGKSRNIIRFESIDKRMFYELTFKSFIKLPF